MTKALPNLFIIRFLLATVVVISHIPETSRNLGFPAFNNLPLFNKGILAVFYFFSLSGFLIIRNLYIEQRDKGAINIKKFYSRRVRRFMPVYFLVISVGIIVYHYLLPLFKVPFKINYPLSHLILYYIALVPNIFNSIYRVGGILNVLWSIGIEEQFYLVVPVLLFLFRRKIVIVLLILLAVLLLILFSYPKFYIYHNFYFYFAAGGLIAILCEQKRCNFLNNKIFSMLLLLTFILNFTTNVFNFENESVFHLYNMIVSTLFIASISYYPQFIIKNRLLNYLGKISYGIYMYHIIVMTGYFFVLQKLNLKVIVNKPVTIAINYLSILVFTLIVAHLSYRYFETMFYHKRKAKASGTLATGQVITK